MGWTPELAIVAGRIDVLLAHAEQASTIATRRFALDALARGLLLADPGTVDRASREAALALRVDPSTASAAGAPRQPHAVSVPLVLRGGGLAFVRQVHVAFDPVGLLADDRFLQPRARHAIAGAIGRAALRAPPPSDPSMHRLVAARPSALHRAQIDGPSLAAATYASAVALWSGRAVRGDVVVTGALRDDAVVSVGAMEDKVRAAHAHRAAAIVVPAADAPAARAAAAGLDDPPEIVPVADVDALRHAVIARGGGPRARPEREVRDARRQFSTGWNGYRWPSIRTSLSRLSGTLPTERVDLRVEVLCRLAAAQRHLGDPVGARAILEQAQDVVDSEPGRAGVPDDKIAYLLQQVAMTEKQLCRFEEASAAAQRGVQVARDARLLGVLIRALGVVGLVALADGDVEAAVCAFDESLDVTLRWEPHRTARTHAYLIEAHGAAGRFDDARAHFEAAMIELDAADDEEDRRSRESWVRTSWGGALYALDRPADAIAALDVPTVRASLEDEPLPGLLARRWLGLALCRDDATAARGCEVLAASPLVHGRALAPHLSFLAHLNVLYEAATRRARDEWGPDIAGRARRALEHLPRYGRVEASVGDARVAVSDALERAEPPPPADLDALLDRCRRLG